MYYYEMGRYIICEFLFFFLVGGDVWVLMLWFESVLSMANLSNILTFMVSLLFLHESAFGEVKGANGSYDSSHSLPMYAFRVISSVWVSLMVFL